MRTWLNKSFSFSRSQFNGLIVLISIVLLVKCIPYLYRYVRPVERINADLLLRLQDVELLSTQKSIHLNVKSKPGLTPRKYFKFNPNVLPEDGWISLGFTAKQARPILNYIRKGGKFYRTEDLQKMYTISPEMYQQIYPYVDIPQEKQAVQKETFGAKVYERKAPVYIEINTADSATLDEMKGIGGVFARRILRYRERLGGFHSKQQLLEVYGLDTLKYAEISNQFYIDASKIKTMNINTVKFEDLKTFPYLTYKQMNAIIQYRKQHGLYRNSADLAKVALLNAGLIEKVLPYITF